MSVFTLPTCATSTVAFNLHKLIRETLDEAVFVSPSNNNNLDTIITVHPILYSTSREILDLYRAIIPATQGNSLSTIPRCAAVFHNDCVYYSHILLLLGIRYKEDFQKLLDKLCTFVDIVPAVVMVAETSV